MQTLTTIDGLTPREWSALGLPYGKFEEMVRRVDPFYGIYADAGATKKPYLVTGCQFGDDEWYEDELRVDAFNALHAMAIAHDERGWSIDNMSVCLA
jgi:hypothetical protein